MTKVSTASESVQMVPLQNTPVVMVDVEIAATSKNTVAIPTDVDRLERLRQENGVSFPLLLIQLV